MAAGGTCRRIHKHTTLQMGILDRLFPPPPAPVKPPTPDELIAEIGTVRLSEIYRIELAKLSRNGLKAEFHDDHGRLWSTFQDDSDIPVTRMSEAHTHLQYLAAGVSAETLQKSLDAVSEQFAKGKMVEAGAILFNLTELGKRIVNFDALINVIAVHYVREDEDPIKFSATIHGEKCNYLKHETEEGRFFFRLPIALRLLHASTISTEDAQMLWSQFMAAKTRQLSVLSTSTSPPPTEK